MRMFLSLILSIIFLTILPVSGEAKKETNRDSWATSEVEIRWFSPGLRGLKDRFLSLKELLKKNSSNIDLSKVRYWNKFIKESFSEIAQYYESQGLKQPYLPITTDDGVKRYVIYVYDFKSGEVTKLEKRAGGFYQSGPCENKLNTLSPTIDFDPNDPKLAIDFNSVRNEKVSGITTKHRRDLYSTIAHELFHAIQASYDREFKSILWCQKTERNGRDAVIEGTATAAETLATEKKYPGWLKWLKKEENNIGAFPYGDRQEFLKANSPLEAIERESRLEYKTSSFWRYLAERFGGLKVFDRLLKEKLSGATLEARYQWLNRAVKSEKIAGKPLYILFPEFQAEFASYMRDRYFSLQDRFFWLNYVYRHPKGCHVINLDSDNFFGVVEFSRSEPLYRNGATCIDVKWSGLKPNDKIEVEAIHYDINLIDQLHLGVSYMKRDGMKADSCFDRIVVKGKNSSIKRKGKDLECSFGKVFIKRDSKNQKHLRTWILGEPEEQDPTGSFFSQKLGNKGRAALVLTNMADDPNQTKDISKTNAESDKMTLIFSIARSKFADGRQFHPVKMIQLRDFSNMMPGIPAGFAGMSYSSAGDRVDYSFIKAGFGRSWGFPETENSQSIDRYSIYGIKKPSPMLQGGLGSTFQTVSATDPKKKYSIAPLNPNEFKFGYIGPFSGIVANEANAISTLCKSNMGKPIGEITKSDDEQLRFKISTDLCKAVGSEFKKVDSITAEFIFPFGRRAFPETAPQDVITPGLELYIDEYLKELARRGIQLPPTVLLLDGTHPNDAVSSDPDNPSSNPTAPNKKKSKTIKGGCDCSCEAFAKFKKAAEEAKRDPKKRLAMMSAMRCVQSCMQQWGKCPKK